MESDVVGALRQLGDLDDIFRVGIVDDDRLVAVPQLESDVARWKADRLEADPTAPPGPTVRIDQSDPRASPSP
jgi:hypothetical protein